jgi:hypothetical protein
MAYGTPNINDQVFIGSSQSENPNQLNYVLFSDLHNNTTPSTTIPTEGGNFYCVTSLGGAITNNSTAPFLAMGVTASSGVIQLATGTSNNSTAYVTLQTSPTVIPGIPVPSAGQVTKYEFETLIRTGATIHSNSVRGIYRLGFFDNNGFTSAGDSTGFGPHFKFLCDGTTTHTTWNVFFGDAVANFATVDTGVAVAADTTYRMYLSVEVDSSGIYTTTYKIKNMTTGTNTEGIASPPSSAYYPANGYTTAMGAGIVNAKSAVTSTTTSIILYVDYMTVHIQRPISREILIFS